MFQSIKYLNYAYDSKTKLYHYNYEITDSDFISNSSVTVTAMLAAGSVAKAATLIKTYESKNYTHQEIISNLFLLNMVMLKENCYWYNNLNEILKYQNTYLTKEYYPESNFHEKYYDDLVKYTNKIIVILD